MEEIGGDPGASLFSGSLWQRLDAAEQLLTKAESKLPLLKSLRAEGYLSARGLFLAAGGLLLLLLLPPLIARLLRKCNRLETNFRGDRIPQSFGLVILLWAGLLLSLTHSLYPAQRSEITDWLTTVLGYGALGFVDDTWGTKRIKGLKGHFRAAWVERQITTGFIKAVGGVLLALWLGFRLHPTNLSLALLAAALIALCANAINLLDLRPGRAGAVFLLCALPLLAWTLPAGTTPGVPPLLYVALPDLVVWQRDAKAQAMLGDTGSNLLGACLGLALAETNALSLHLTALLLLILLHIAAERVSLTKVIEKQPLLRALDLLTGER